MAQEEGSEGCVLRVSTHTLVPDNPLSPVVPGAFDCCPLSGKEDPWDRSTAYSTSWVPSSTQTRTQTRKTLTLEFVD